MNEFYNVACEVVKSHTNLDYSQEILSYYSIEFHLKQIEKFKVSKELYHDTFLNIWTESLKSYLYLATNYIVGRHYQKLGCGEKEYFAKGNKCAEDFAKRINYTPEELKSKRS